MAFFAVTAICGALASWETAEWADKDTAKYQAIAKQTIEFVNGEGKSMSMRALSEKYSRSNSLEGAYRFLIASTQRSVKDTSQDHSAWVIQSLNEINRQLTAKSIPKLVAHDVFYTAACWPGEKPRIETAYRALKEFDSWRSKYAAANILYAGPKMKDRQKAVALYHELLKLEPSQKSLNYNLGAAYWYLAEKTKKKSDYSLALKHWELGIPYLPKFSQEQARNLLSSKKKQFSKMNFDKS